MSKVIVFLLGTIVGGFWITTVLVIDCVKRL